jgi:hypothetical protein
MFFFRDIIIEVAIINVELLDSIGLKVALVIMSIKVSIYSRVLGGRRLYIFWSICRNGIS